MSESAYGQDEGQELLTGFGKMEVLGDRQKTCFPRDGGMKA